MKRTRPILLLGLVLCVGPEMRAAALLSVSDVTESAAVVSLSMRYALDARIVCGPPEDPFVRSYRSKAAAKTHTFRLEGLRPGAEYVVRAFAYPPGMPNGEATESAGPAQFRTKTRLVLHLREEKTTHAEALLSFDTGEPSFLEVVYGEAGKPLSMAKRSRLGSVHPVRLEGLRPGSGYAFRATARSRDGREAVLEGGFRTRPENIAASRPVLGTFTRLRKSRFVDDTTRVLGRVNDGDFGWYSGLAVSGDVAEAAQEVFVDLLASEAVGLVRVFWHATAYPRDFSVNLSEDGRRWLVLGRGLDAGKGEVLRSPTGDPLLLVTVEGGGARGRYLHLYVPRGGRIFSRAPGKREVQLVEIEAYREEKP
jgi:hypothetical protein